MSSRPDPTSSASPSIFDQALDLLARMHASPSNDPRMHPNVDFRGDPVAPAEQQRRLRVRMEDRPVEPSEVQPTDLIGLGGIAKVGLKMAGRKVAEKLAPAVERKAGNWVLNKAEMGLDAFDRALVSKQNEFAVSAGRKATAVDPSALRNEAAEAITTSGRQDITR